MTTSDSLSAASSAQRRRFAQRLSARGPSLRSETSPSATPPAIASPTLSTPAVVSGESGGGPFNPTALSFDSADAVENEVHAFVFSEFDMCGATIGRGQFFCTRTGCNIPAHQKPTARLDKRLNFLYIPAAGTAEKAFCQPTVDATTLSEEMTNLLTASAYKPSRIKLVINQLHADPASMTLEQAYRVLSLTDPDNFRERVKKVMTPAKPSDFDIPLIEQAQKALDDQQAIPSVPDLPGEETIVGKDLIPFVNRFTMLKSSVSEVLRLVLMHVKETDDVKVAGDTALLELESKVGSDPGVGGVETGQLSSAWEGITFLSDGMEDVRVEIGRDMVDLNEKIEMGIEELRDEQNKSIDKAKQALRGPIRTLQNKLDNVTSTLDDWDEKISTSVVERSGAYSDGLTAHIKSIVTDFVDEWMGDDEMDVGGISSANTSGHSPSTATNVAGSDLDTHAELTQLLKDYKIMRAELDHLKSVTSTGSLKFPTDGFEFENEDDLLRFFEEADENTQLPPDFHILFIDLWAMLDQASTSIDGENRQASDSQLARQQEASIKAKFTNPTALSRWGGFQRSIPLAFEPPNTPPSSNPILIPLPGLKKPEDWDNQTNGALGRKQQVKKACKADLATLSNDINASIKNSDVRNLANAFKSATKSHEQSLYEWVHETYEHEMKASSAAEAWALVAGCVRAIFDDIRQVRLVGRSIHGLSGIRKDVRMIWAMGMGIMKMEEFVQHSFAGHTSCVAVYTQYMNRARTPLSTFKQLEQKVKTSNGEIVKLQGAVNQLKSQRGGRRNNQNNNNNAGNGQPDESD